MSNDTNGHSHHNVSQLPGTNSESPVTAPWSLTVPDGNEAAQGALVEMLVANKQLTSAVQQQAARITELDGIIADLQAKLFAATSDKTPAPVPSN